MFMTCLLSFRRKKNINLLFPQVLRWARGQDPESGGHQERVLVPGRGLGAHQGAPRRHPRPGQRHWRHQQLRRLPGRRSSNRWVIEDPALVYLKWDWGTRSNKKLFAAAPANNDTGQPYKDWVFINYTFKRFEGLTQRGIPTAKEALSQK